MKIWLPLPFLLFLIVIGSTMAQTFQSARNGNWNSPNTWMVSNQCTNSYNSPPPTEGYYPQCAIDIIISHAVTFSGNTAFGAGYFRSITVKPGSLLKFNNDFVLSTGGSEYVLKIKVENGGKIEIPNGSFKFQRNALVEIESGGILSVKNLEGGGGNGGTLHLKAGAILTSTNLINLNNGLRLKIEGTCNANTLISQGGGNEIQVSGEGKFETSGDVDINGFPFSATKNSLVKIGGNLTITNSGQSKLYLEANSQLVVSGKTYIGNLFQASNDATVLLSKDVEVSNSGEALLEVKNQADVLITGNLKKQQWSGGITVQNSGQLVICNDLSGQGTNSGAYPPTSFSQMNIAPSPAFYGGCRIMPVDFLSFTATIEKLGSKSTLTWSTAKEWQNSHFEIERSIDDITNWKTIGEVEGNGFSDSSIEYTFADRNLPTEGSRIYYRIRQVNFDKKTSYSSIQAIQLDPVKRIANWTAYPNPTNGTDFRLELTDPGLAKDAPLYAILSSTHGQQSLVSGTTVDEINTSLKTELSQKIAGVYLIKVMWGENSQTLTIIKN